MKVSIAEFLIENSQYLQSSPDGCGFTCREAFEDALDSISQGDDNKAEYVQSLTDLQVKEILEEFEKDYSGGMERIDKDMVKMYEEVGEDDPTEMNIYCFLYWEV